MTNEDMNSLMERYKKQLIEFEKRTSFPRMSSDEQDGTSNIVNITQNNVQLNQSPTTQSESNSVEIRDTEPLAQPANSALFEMPETPQQRFDVTQQPVNRQAETQGQVTGPRLQLEIPRRTQNMTEVPQRPIVPQAPITQFTEQRADSTNQMDAVPQMTATQRSGTVENEIHRPEFLNVPELSSSRMRTADNTGEIIAGQNLSRHNTPEASERYREYTRNFNKKGLLRVETFASTGLYPVSNSRVVVYKNIDGQNYYIYDLFTDASGILNNLELPAPDKSLSLSPDDNGVIPYATYNVYVEHPNFTPMNFENVPVFDGVVSIQSVEMIPTVNGGTQPNPVRVVELEPRL